MEDFKLWLEIIRNSVIILAALFGAYIANEGLQTWRRQLVGTSEFHAMRELRRAAYKLDLALRSVRIPSPSFSPPSQGDKSAELKHYDSEARRYLKLWTPVDEATANLREATLEARVFIGPDVREAIRPLHTCRAELKMGVMRYLDHLLHKPTEVVPQSTVNLIYEIREDPADEYTSKLEEALQGIEALPLPHITRKKC